MYYDPQEIIMHCVVCMLISVYRRENMSRAKYRALMHKSVGPFWQTRLTGLIVAARTLGYSRKGRPPVTSSNSRETKKE